LILREIAFSITNRHALNKDTNLFYILPNMMKLQNVTEKTVDFVNKTGKDLPVFGHSWFLHS
jgi:hypothetical protein